SALAIVESVVRGRGAPLWGPRLGRAFAGAGDVLRGLGAKTSLAAHNGRVFEILVRSEQAPNRNSRIMLNGQRDLLGIPCVDLDWRVAKQDTHTVRDGIAILAEACAAAGVGQVFVPPYGEDVPPADAVHGGWHQMGTTRMSRDPKGGVVDENCRVHGVANLF